MPLACFQCVDNLPFAAKHTKGESTEKVEKRDFRAVSNGYKPPQNLYFIHYFYSFLVLSKYHVPTGFGFSPKASGFYPFGDATDLAGEVGVGDVGWLVQAPA